jgi:crooked neck
MATWKALEKLDRDRNFNKTSIVKNKQPAAIQITAEQILREAKDRQDKPIPRAVQTIVDKEELDEYQLIKRREFENTVRRNRMATGAWLNYAKWEEVQKEYARSRSVFERALDFDPRSHVLWLRYCEMEMRLKNVNRARNILNRAVSILPRVDMFWYKFTYMEEMLLNITGARQVFDRWMEWEPTEDAYMAFVKFELRYNEFDLARKVYQRFVTAFPLRQKTG